MTADTSNIILEMLRENRDLHRKTQSEIAEIKHHTLALRDAVAQLTREDTYIYQLIADHTARLDRLEERLKLKD